MPPTNLLTRLCTLPERFSHFAARSRNSSASLTRQLDAWGQETLLLLALLSVTFALSRGFELFANRPPDWTHLGAEYWNIARALTEGRGFADPFGHQTGPTSWMAPLYSLLLAALLSLLQSKVAVAQAIAAASNVAFALVGVIVFRVARRHCHWLSPYLVVLLYVGWLCVFYSSYFMLSHDIWFVALIASFLVLLLSTFAKTGTIVGWKWGLFGGIALLCNPSLAMAWGALMVLQYWRLPQHRRKLLWAGALAAALASPWVVRNAVVFHQFIPTKSNLGYEAYQSNNIDDDGVYDELSFWQHPYVSLEARQRYAQAGERAFIREHQQAFLASVQRAPARYLDRAKNRVLATTLLYPPVDEQDQSGLGYSLRRVVYALPFLGALLALWLTKRERALVVRLCAVYFAFLIPYGLVAFYVRHLFALTPLLVLLVSLGVDAGLGRLGEARANRTNRLRHSESASPRADKVAAE